MTRAAPLKDSPEACVARDVASPRQSRRTTPGPALDPALADQSTRRHSASGHTEGNPTMTTDSRLAATPCPVEAIIDDLAVALSLQAGQTASIRGGAELDERLDGVLDDRVRALVSVAETSKATSLRGAALQVILAADLAADMAAALMCAKVHEGYDGRTTAELDRVAEGLGRATYKTLAALGGALPQVIVERWLPLECDAWAALAAAGKVPLAA